MAAVAAFLVLARIALLARDIVLAAKFGTGSTVDAFNVAFAVINWPTQILVSLMTIALVPALVELGMADSRQDQAKLLGEMNAMALTGAILTAVTLWLLASPLTGLFAGDLSQRTTQSALEFTRGFAPVAGFLVLAGYLGVRLQALRDNSFTLFEGLPALGIIVLVVLGSHGLAQTESRFVLGLLVGAIAQCAALLMLLRRRHEPFGGILPSITAPQWRSIGTAMGAMAIGQVLMSLTIPVDQYFVARLGDGELARFGYASRIVSLVNTLGSVVIGRVLLASFTEKAVGGVHAESLKAAVGWAAAFLAGGLAIALLGQGGLDPVISLIFQRGAFGSDEVGKVADMAAILVFQIPLFLAGMVLVQWYASRRDYTMLLRAAICGLVLKGATIAAGAVLYNANWVLWSTVTLYIGTFGYMAAGLVKRAHSRKQAGAAR